MLEIEAYSFEKMLKEKGYLVFTNVGTSMLPLLRERRDIIEIRPVNGRIKKYDVALYKRGNMYVLHRCLGSLSNGNYIFAGDNNYGREYDVTDEMILGVMSAVIRNGKNLSISDWRYKAYYHIWCDCYPVPVFIMHLVLKVRRC